MQADAAEKFSSPPLDTWRRYTHFNGKLYYHHPSYQIITPDDVWSEEVCDAVWSHYVLFRKRIRENGWDLPCDAIVELLEEHPTYAAVASVSLGGTLDWETGKFKAKTLWAFLCMYPMTFTEIPLWIENEFIHAMVFGANEHILGYTNSTTFPFDATKTERILQVYWDLKARQSTPGSAVVPAILYHTAEAMEGLRGIRHLYEFGTDTAITRKPTSHQASRSNQRKPPFIVDCVLYLLLLGPHVSYRERMMRVAVIDPTRRATPTERLIADVHEFRRLMRGLLMEWADSNLLATVFASANVAFLAVPDITSLQRTASLASTIFSILSIAAGVHHVWQHRAKTEADLDEAYNYFTYAQFLSTESHDGAKYSSTMTLISCFLSIPLSMLMWSVLAFTVALGAAAIQSTERWGTILMGVVICVLVVLGVAMMMFFHWPRAEVVESRRGSSRQAEVQEGHEPNSTEDKSGSEETGFLVWARVWCFPWSNSASSRTLWEGVRSRLRARGSSKSASSAEGTQAMV